MNAQAQYDRSKVVQIVNSVITKMEGSSTDALKSLSTELQSLGEAIERIKVELAEARTGDVPDNHVPTATEELDAVVSSTKQATDDIMNACDAISAAAALVNVRQRIDSGRAPLSNNRSTRAVSTWVFPVPADAESAACARGSAASA